MKPSSLKALFLMAALCLSMASCHQLNDERIPGLAVNISLDNQGLWNVYGVHGIGDFKEFIFNTTTREPRGFPYNYNSATGYGGVLLIGGQNAYTGDIAPLAYDLSCPVERLPEIRVYVDMNNFEAICPECDSHYNVVEWNGAPISGPAEKLKYAMTHYQCYATVNGGYIITN